MPRLMLTKNYREAAEAMFNAMDNGVVTEHTEMVGDKEIKEIWVEGNFVRFDIRNMDMWGGYLRFSFRDNAPADDAERSARGELAMAVPQLANLFTAMASMSVERRDTVSIETRIIKTVNGRRQPEEVTVTPPEDLWIDVTEEFTRVMEHEELWRTRHDR